MQGAGIALAPALMFDHEINTGRLVRPFEVEVHAGSYWLTGLKGKPMTPAMLQFSQWIVGEAASGGQTRQTRQTPQYPQSA
jgi:LysR family transcriptional regulator of beta-lactamase